MADKNIFHRAGDAWSVFRKDVGPSEQKAPPYMWPAFNLGKPSWSMGASYASFVQEGFNKNALIYSCIMYKARAIAEATMRAYGGDEESPERLPLDNELARIVTRPNVHQSWYEFQSLNTVYLNIDGNSFTYIDRPKRDSLEGASLWPMRPDRVGIVPGRQGMTYGIMGYVYRPEGMEEDKAIPMLPEDVIHVKFPNPADPYEGMGRGTSPFLPLAWSAEVDNEVTRFLKIFFERGMMPPYAISYDTPLNEDIAARVKERWMEIYGGTEGMVEPAILEKGAKLERLGYSFNELGFEGIDNRNESRVIMPFGVPPILIGSRYGLERSTYSNYAEARLAFWQDTMIPELKAFQDEYQYYLQGDDEWVEFDLSEVPALQKNIPELTTAAKTLFDMGVPVNQALNAVGMKVEDVPGGDIAYIPLNLVPTGLDQEPDQIGQPVDAEDDTRDNKMLMYDEQKRLHHKNIDKIATKWEKVYLIAAKEQFEEDRRHVLALLESGRKKSVERKATPQWEQIIIAIEAYMLGGSREAWRAKFMPLILETGIDQGTRWAGILDKAFVPQDISASLWFQDYTMKFADPITDNSSKQIKFMLEQAMDEGWSIPKTRDNLNTMFKQWIDGDVDPTDWEFANQRKSGWRSEAIARTETIRASNGANDMLYNKWGVKRKEWLAVMDQFTRDTHFLMDGQVVPADQAFQSPSGAKLEFPGDPRAPLEETVNCRCAVAPVVG